MKKTLGKILVILTLCFYGGFFSIQQAEAATNLLTNGDFSAGDSTGWTIIENGGSGASFAGLYATSFTWNSISQTVDLVAAGYSAEELDNSPDIEFNISTSQRFDHDGYYYLEYKLLAEDGSTVKASQLYGSVGSPIYLTADTAAFDTIYTFSGYATGVRYAYIKIAGQDGSPDWGGQYGPYFDDASITFPDTTNPTVSDLFPADNSPAVPIDSNLVITFDEIVDAETGNIELYNSDDTLIQQFNVTTDISGTGTTEITINPTADLDEQTSYYVKIDATAFDDISGNSYAGIADEITWNFTTADETNPSISTRSPLDNATSVTTSTNFIITFDEAVDVETGNVVIYKSNNDAVFETIDVTSGKVSGTGTATITVNPSGTLAEQTSYYVKIDATAFDDISGNSYAGIADEITWNFTTADETNPVVSGLSPSDGLIDVTINTNLVITFSEAVDVESGNIVIYKSSDNSIFETIDVTSTQVSGTGTNTITVDPTNSFATNTACYIKIAAAAFDDITGNSYVGITTATSWNFITIEGEEDNASVLVDGGNQYSTDNNVSVEILGTDTLSEISQMIVSESPNFTGAVWEDFSSEKFFELSAGDGVKAIYVRYRDSERNVSEIFVDYITVDTIMTLDLESVAAQEFSTEIIGWETTDTTPTFSGTAEPNSTVVITIQSDPITTNITVGVSGEWSWTPDSSIPIGNHTVVVVGTDLAGNTSTVSFGLGITAEDILEEEIIEEDEATEEVVEEDEVIEDTPVIGDQLPISGLATIFWGFVLEIILIISFFLSLNLLPRKKGS